MDRLLILSQINNGEGQYLEFKSSFAEDNEAIESLCAFANARGGTVLFGVSNEGKIIGVTIGKNTIEQFTNKIRSQTQPPVNPTIEQFTEDGKTIVIISIDKAGEGTLHFAFGKAYIRIGKTNQIMTPTEITQRLAGASSKGNSAIQTQIPSPNIDPVRIVRIKQNIPEYLNKLSTGQEILGVLGGCLALSYSNDELTNQTEVDLIGDFFQLITDYVDLLHDMEPSTRIHLEFDLTQKVKDIEMAGFYIFGAKEVQRIEGGSGKPMPFPVFIIEVVRQTNPTIITTPLDKKY
jgi:hypothetical protein